MTYADPRWNTPHALYLWCKPCNHTWKAGVFTTNQDIAGTAKIQRDCPKCGQRKQVFLAVDQQAST